MTGRKSFLILAAIMSISRASAPVRSAEDCGMRVPEILRKIESQKEKGDRRESLELLRCLGVPAEEMVRSYDEFIQEKTLVDLEEATYKDRLDVIRILVPLLETKDRIVKNEIVAVLAYYRYPPAKQLLSNYPDGPQKAVFYAILGHGRAYLWAIDQLETSKRSEATEDSAFVVEQMAYLNLLYYLSEPRSLPYIDKFIESSQPGTVKNRAEMVRRKICETHPDIK